MKAPIMTMVLTLAQLLGNGPLRNWPHIRILAKFLR